MNGLDVAGGGIAIEDSHTSKRKPATNLMATRQALGADQIVRPHKVKALHQNHRRKLALGDVWIAFDHTLGEGSFLSAASTNVDIAPMQALAFSAFEYFQVTTSIECLCADDCETRAFSTS